LLPLSFLFLIPARIIVVLSSQSIFYSLSSCHKQALNPAPPELFSINFWLLAAALSTDQKYSIPHQDLLLSVDYCSLSLPVAQVDSGWTDILHNLHQAFFGGTTARTRR
jgi:hypothetical protein